MADKHPAHVEQALAEIENAERLGSSDAVAAAQKRLAAAGHKRAAEAVEIGEQEARSAPPRGRTARPAATATD